MTTLRATPLGAALALVLVAVGGLTACGPSVDVPAPQTSGADPLVAPGTPIWVTGRTLHLGRDTTTLPATPWLLQRAGEALFYLDESGVLHRWTGEDARLGRVEARQLVTSKDGRYLGYVDFATGRRTPRGRVAVATVLDLEKGEQVLRADDDMGGWTDDLTDLYEDSEPAVVGFDDEAAYVMTAAAGRIHRYDLTTGAGESLGAGRGDGGDVPLPDDLTADTGMWSPEGSYLATDDSGRLQLRRQDGRRVEPSLDAPDRVRIGGWLDDDTWYGYGYDRGSIETGQVVTCDVGGECVEWGDVEPFVERQRALWPNGDVSFE